MRSLAALTDSVFQQLEGGVSSDDSRLNLDLVRDKVLRVYAELLGDMYRQYIGTLPDDLYRRCCIQLYCVEQCGSGLYRLTGNIPAVVSILGNRGLRFVGTVDGKPFEQRKTSGVRYEQYQPYAITNPSYRIISDKIELLDAPMGLDTIVVEGIFIDPASCPDCKGDEEVFLGGTDLQNKIEVKALKELQQIWMMRKIDIRNDAVPNN